jgi:hypothetical protein
MRILKGSIALLIFLLFLSACDVQEKFCKTNNNGHIEKYDVVKVRGFGIHERNNSYLLSSLFLSNISTKPIIFRKENYLRIFDCNEVCSCKEIINEYSNELVEDIPLATYNKQTMDMVDFTIGIETQALDIKTIMIIVYWEDETGQKFYMPLELNSLVNNLY